jgi:glycosyltransferase involved in cell wall biosynthesis
MLELSPTSQFTLYCREKDEDRAAFVASHAQMREKQVPFRVGWLWNQGAVAPRLKRDKIDVFHAQYLLPFHAPRPMVVSIHDLTFRLFPQWTPKETRRKMNFLIALAARRASRVITISQSSRRDLIEQYHLPPEKVVVTYCAVSNAFSPRDPQESRALIAQNYGLSGDYVVGVGLRGERKNAGVVVRAMNRLKTKNRWPAGVKLALAGQLVHFPDPEIAACQSEIAFLGYVRDEDLPFLYSGALAAFYPSKYEGFGIPPLEAMACGCPVLSSNSSSLPEVVGDAGWMLDPRDEAGWEAALEAVLHDSKQRAAMREKGLIQARKFSWQTAARQTLDVYREALGGF